MTRIKLPRQREECNNIHIVRKTFLIGSIYKAYIWVFAEKTHSKTVIQNTWKETWRSF